jgi:hypothetical protein
VEVEIEGVGRDQHELFFNAARLDRSIVLRTDQYVALAHPRLAPITVVDGAPTPGVGGVEPLPLP